ncbi:hypothetical protein BCR35DRAFT_302406 [Leucosporidium creatinivorum]|uniref:Uncharacterized protein n=1 Tax=Leucosporidium creatinivorum TaxID=106004 RepID=A0A1Y2FU18_9BASI|nr:hypothetical protein BCR35DRAFT_302406 [Leucosporidium creatinivorum]
MPTWLARSLSAARWSAFARALRGGATSRLRGGFARLNLLEPMNGPHGTTVVSNPTSARPRLSRGVRRAPSSSSAISERAGGRLELEALHGISNEAQV